MRANDLSIEHLNLIWSAVEHRKAEINRPISKGNSLHEGVRRSYILDRILNSCVYDTLRLHKYPPLETGSCKYSVEGLRALEEDRVGQHRRIFDRVTYERAITNGALYGLLDDALRNASATIEVISEFVWFVGIAPEEARILAERVPIDGMPTMPQGWEPEHGPFARFEAIGISIL